MKQAMVSYQGSTKRKTISPYVFISGAAPKLIQDERLIKKLQNTAGFSVSPVSSSPSSAPKLPPIEVEPPEVTESSDFTEESNPDVGKVSEDFNSEEIPLEETPEREITAAAQKLIDESDLTDEDVADIQGTGTDGRVLKGDVKRYLEETEDVEEI